MGDQHPLQEPAADHRHQLWRHLQPAGRRGRQRRGPPGRPSRPARLLRQRHRQDLLSLLDDRHHHGPRRNGDPGGPAWRAGREDDRSRLPHRHRPRPRIRSAILREGSGQYGMSLGRKPGHRGQGPRLPRPGAPDRRRLATGGHRPLSRACKPVAELVRVPLQREFRRSESSAVPSCAELSRVPPLTTDHFSELP